MRPDELQSLAVRHVPGGGPPIIHRLGKGLINETYRVVRDGESFALRVAAANPHHLGVDREWEGRLLGAAVAADLAPAIVYCDPRHGILVTRWVEAVPWSPSEVRRGPGIERIAELLRRIHALPMPAPARLMSPESWIDYYSGATPHAGAALRKAATAQLAALAALPGADTAVCHSDLHVQNLIDRGDSLVLLDWEYAHASDPLWDLAGWSANNDFEPELRHELLARYTGRPPTRGESLRLERMGWLYDYVCLLWSELYLSLARDAATDPAAHGQVAARARLLAARLEETK
ncbi:MAG TPA: choline/ethanolamine kinase family protein [Steroidobacteraceae bacterium]|jgi:thiamine kinase|nr:choline/ethanolamine kinase family protein [Steroidobacteraceae bacterium]